jgi:DNA-binding Lrp family transcriptional regulator
MVDTQTYRKNKINLEDYDYRKDIQNRVLLSQLNSEDLEVLEEIIYSPTTFPMSRLAKQAGKTDKEILEILMKLSETGLFKIEEETVIVDKEMRKYFETQLAKFEENFTPGMEFLQALLKKVPIHILPNWYPIPRTSNNIFHSLIEKYLYTPQTFQRYLAELNFNDETLNRIVSDLFNSPNYRIYSHDLREKYGLSDESFEEMILYLEFNFVCCLVFEKQEDEWIEVVTLFQEWKDYLSFLKESQPKEIQKKHQVKRTRPADFSFVEDMSTLLAIANTHPFFVKLDSKERWGVEQKLTHLISKEWGDFDLSTEEGEQIFKEYFNRVIQKLLFLKLAKIEKSRLIPEPDASEWLTLPIEKRALNTYKMTVSRYPFNEFPTDICTERNIHEIEKSISRIIDSNWVFFEDFLKGIIAPISENSKMVLKKTGRYWKYTLPDYSDSETELIRKVIFEWLFEGGIIATGMFEGAPCLQITPLGQSMFG